MPLFQPHIGKDYRNQKFRILILGESHYFGEEDMQLFHKNNKHPHITNITQNVVKNYIQYKQGKAPFHRWMNTFTRFSNATEGKTLSNSETVDFWERIAFYNFVQFPISGPRIAPTAEQFVQSKETFKKVLKDLNPHLVVFWGFRLWQNFDKSQHKNINGIDYLSYDRDYPIYILPHPSSTVLDEQHKMKYQHYIAQLK